MQRKPEAVIRMLNGDHPHHSSNLNLKVPLRGCYVGWACTKANFNCAQARSFVSTMIMRHEHTYCSASMS